MNLQPAKIRRIGEDRLLIEWNDGALLEYENKQLRVHCPCAQCKGEDLPIPMTPACECHPLPEFEEGKALQVIAMRPVGNYAYAIDFSDGHNMGIYTFDLLRSLGKAASGE